MKSLDIAQIIQFPVQEWLTSSCKTNDTFVCQTADDEGAQKVFGNCEWERVDPYEVLQHPTAQWFLTDVGFVSQAAAIMACCRWGRTHTSHQGQARLLFDHFEANTERRRPRLVGLLSAEQLQSLLDFCDEERRQYDLIDQSENDLDLLNPLSDD